MALPTSCVPSDLSDGNPSPKWTAILLLTPARRRPAYRQSDQLGSASKSLNNDETWTRKKVSVSAGFLGQTSYSDVFTDATSGLSTGRLHVVDQDTIPVDSRRINLGAQVLALLENLPFYREVITARFKVWKGWTIGWKVTDMVLTVVEEMWNSYEREEMDTMPRAVLMSRRLFETHTRSFDITSSTTWEEFQITASGRWETIGLLFTLVGVATDLVSHDHPLFTDPDAMDASTLANTASAVGDICLQFCDNSGIINDIVSWMLLHQITLLGVVYGEGAFTVDKVLATFLGRPPLISWRFCNISMPLDLSMEEVFAEPAVRDAAIAQLDANTGWNQEGTLKKGPWARTALITSVLREKVLDLSLSWQTDKLSERVEELAQESRRLRNALPEFLRWKPDGDGVGISRIEDAFLFELDLEFLHNDFLLYRTLGQRTQTKPQEIIETSREILKALILMVSKIIRWGQSVSGAGWVFQLCLPGLPCAGVLSAELLRQSRSTIPASSSNFPRSEIIQNLTLYASYLDTMIRPDEGNHRLAQQGQKAIRHVLDQVLSAEQLPPAIDGNDWSDIVARNDDNIFDGMNVDDNGLLFSLVDGSMQQMSDSWLTWVNFT
ncbi:hypothetical protein MYU51_018239 [Penicillium brevicompactum]